MTAKKYNFPKGLSLLESVIHSQRFLNEPIEFVSENIQKFGTTYKAMLPPNKQLVITQDPDLVNYLLKENHRNYHKSALTAESAAQFFGKGILFSNGDYWLRQRRLIQPAFHKEKIAGLNNIIIKTVHDFLVQFPTGQAIDVYPHMHQLAFNIIIQSMFDIELPANAREQLSDLFNELQEFYFKEVNQPLRKLFYPFTGAKKLHLDKAKKLRAIFSQIIQQRKAEGKAYADLLDMLLNSRYEDSGEAMSEDQLIDELFIIIFAGHETTANALSWLLHLLATHPQQLKTLQAVVQGESIEQSLGNDYLKACINETMRLFPPAWITDRVALADDTFGAYHFHKGTIFMLYLYGLHHDEQHWANAEQFVPERFVQDPQLLKSKSFFPFGAGPRMCIGNNFAITEMCFFVAAFLQQFNIANAGHLPVKRPLITLRPDKVLLHVQRR
jgi:cytochrome P450